MACGFIKVHVVYPKHPGKYAKEPEELSMREVYIDVHCIQEITPIIAEDEALVSKTYIKVDYTERVMSVIESAEEILEEYSKIHQGQI